MGGTHYVYAVNEYVVQIIFFYQFEKITKYRWTPYKQE